MTQEMGHGTMSHQASDKLGHREVYSWATP